VFYYYALSSNLGMFLLFDYVYLNRYALEYIFIV